ncbi:MAG TPA: SDR family oxidoreductase [Dehalococcoidia bacterium]|nr:SDR family oxidoreductase [Dehalococcoidia bacterium]
MPGHLEGKVIVVTGGGRGIGRGVAMLAAREGAKVVVCDAGVAVDGSGADAGPAQEVVREIKGEGGAAVASNSNISTMAGGEAAIKAALDNFQRLDCVINVAGILRDRMVFNMTEEEWDAVIAVHLKGHFATIKPASIIFRQQRSGRIINYTSVSGLIGSSGQANYGAAKAGIAGLTRVVARDLGRYGATCNAISPGASTRMTATVPDSTRERRAASGIQSGGSTVAAAPNPAMQMREPEYVAPMTCWLATDAAWNVNGQIFNVNGGTVALLNHPTPLKTIWKPGMWTLDELDLHVPSQLLAGYQNPAPPPADLAVAGREAKATA